ncbi:Cof-type HAD-IIB family hydrolase [Clostridium estertheticum]|uniref:Cof-type HAD-IIB family hydrolase n=1 Tax=Clostridium estertheticum TaxID=238834 RepID=UPI001CF3E5B9|nr:Cof-type HAD-IIB family hydrolase [Clostridium estertheticum]MCB2305819.1 Cof-type HAD-IIB family hydrolase [Clostridium estertheticum]MCB2344212.1 Cof-type HAD-IIB family hydrolase [Clostridium estertheticum]MCB2348174.1 Cof-type HAD-IIB family hydrolase [Clostridium estertheticum]WAG45809.1 Cof-type HAD-IIB family hydrolase [Clostridium estertheticum]
MIKYKWCVCDMDGTLLNSDNVISKDNEVALKKLQKMGVEVIIASGRLDLMVKTYIKQLNLKGPVISCNGGLVRNIETGEVLYSKVMDKIAVKEVTTYCNNNEIEFIIYTADLVYSTKNNLVGKRYADRNKILLQDEQIPIKYIDDKVMANINDVDAFKVLLVCEKHEDIILLQKHFSKYDNLTVVSSATGLLDIMASDISKGKALEILSKKLDVSLDEIIVFGDNYNDIEMFKCAGMPIAMENAVEDVKLAAKYITKSNNESGIAYAINNYILKE